MTRQITFFCIAILAFVTSAIAHSNQPVIVELFTSQGCQSCPPADELLHKLAERDDVIPLSLHVDYWDYIGWSDRFALPEHAERQRAYAANAGRRSIYTPQMIINGVTSVVGARGMELSDAIRTHSQHASKVSLSVEQVAGHLNISAQGEPAPMVVNLIRYSPREDVSITTGENAGRTFSYVNVVKEWTLLAEWDGQNPLSLSVEMTDGLPCIILIQKQKNGLGEVLAVQQVR